MLNFLTISSIAVYILIIRKGFSAQNFFLVSLIYAYQFILLASIYLSIPLDIFEDSDDPTLRFELARLNLLFFAAIYLGQLMENFSSRIFLVKHLENSHQFMAAPLFIVLIAIVVAQFITMPPRILSGEYSNEKPGYYFEYFTIFFCLYFTKVLPCGFLKLLPFIAFCAISALAGERLMLITAACAFIYYKKPFKINLKTLIYLAFAVFMFLELDTLRSGTDSERGLIARFIFSEKVTHHGSLLYSTLVLLDYANNTPVSIASWGKSISFLLGLDQSTEGFGLAAELSSFGRRGGGGFLPGYLCVLFGNFFGSIFTFVIGFVIGVLIQAHRQGKQLGFISLVYISFTSHFIIYTPVLILKPVLFALIIGSAWSLANVIFVKNTTSLKLGQNALKG